MSKWYDLVASLTWGDVKKYYHESITKLFETLEDTEKVNLSKCNKLRGKNVVLSAFCGVPSAKRAKLKSNGDNVKSSVPIPKKEPISNLFL